MSEIKLKDAGQLLLARVQLEDEDGVVREAVVKVAPAGSSWDGTAPFRFTEPRWVDEHCYGDQAVELDDQRSVKRLEAQLSDRRRWVDEGFHQVDDSTVILATVSATNHVLVVKAWRAGYYKPGTLGWWQRFSMERYEPSCYIDLGELPDAELVLITPRERFQWVESDVLVDPERPAMGFKYVREVVPPDPDAKPKYGWVSGDDGLLDEAADLAFKWAAQEREQLRYDMEGFDTVVGAPDSWYRDHREFAKPVKTSWCPATYAEWKVTKLPTAGRPDSWKLPYMRNVGAAPDEEG